ncbi:MAG: ABC transporter ATP-binding protein [Gammaproteobacteria bacterium]|nr:ABC transporter ATP-binding protein [Gammaproteobacteria bacterium]
MNSQREAAGIRIDNLSLSFGETEVLKRIDLVIEPGEFFAFLGPSGSGKSTLLRAIAGFGPRPKGRILIGGEDVTGRPPWKRNLGMVFQSYALWPHMTVYSNVAFGLEERRVSREQTRNRVMAALDLVGLADYAHRRPSQLSGGQQQRVALARTVVIEPRVLLLDEPLSNLDANLRVQMRQEILELQRTLNLTTVFVTHDQEEANTTSDRLAVLNDGHLQQVGTPMSLYDQPENSFVAGFMGIANILKGNLRLQDGGSLFESEKGTCLPLKTERTGKCSIVFRPQNVEVLKPGSPLEADHHLIAGKVLNKEFLGSILRYEVQVGGDRILIDHSHQQFEATMEKGADVEIALATDHLVILQDT